METIRDKIDTLKMYGWTRYKIAQELEINRQTLGNWYYEKVTPSVPLAYKFNKLYKEITKQK